MPLTRQPVELTDHKISLHLWGRDKSGKSGMALSAPRPCLINFDRNEDVLLNKMGMTDIYRDRIVAPAGKITYQVARPLLTQFEKDIDQAVAMRGSLVETVVIDGGSLAEEIITIVTLEENENKNNTYRYATRNAYIKNLFNSLNESGLNVIWTSKAKPMWVGDKKVPNAYVPDCHDDIPFMVGVNVQMVTEPKAEGVGLNFYGIIGRNGYKPELTGLRVKDLTFDALKTLIFSNPAASTAEESPSESAA